MVPSQLPLPLLLSLSQLRFTRLNLISCGFANFVPEEIAFLNHKVAVFTDFFAVMSLHGLVKREAVFGNVAFSAVGG